MGKLLIGTALTLLNYDISVGSHGLLGIVPHFLGFILIFFGARQFEKDSSYFDRLQLPCYIMVVYSAAYYMIKATGLIHNIENFNRFIVYFMDLVETIGILLVSYLVLFAITNLEHKKRRNWGLKRLQKAWKGMVFCYILFYISYITNITSGAASKELTQFAFITAMIMIIFNLVKVFGSVVYLMLFYGVWAKYVEDVRG